MSASVAASWAVPEVAAARSKRYGATIQIGDKIEVFRSVPAALHSLGIFSGVRSIRAKARDCEHVEIDLEGRKIILSALEIH